MEDSFYTNIKDLEDLADEFEIEPEFVDRCLFIGGSFTMSQAEQKRYLQKNYGEVLKINVTFGRDKKTKRNFCFVTMKTVEAFQKLITIKHIDINGGLLNIRPAYSKKYSLDKLKSVKDRKIFIHNIPLSVNMDIIKKYFEEFGKIKSITKKVSEKKKNSEQEKKCFVFIEYEFKDDIDKVFEKGARHIIPELDFKIYVNRSMLSKNLGQIYMENLVEKLENQLCPTSDCQPKKDIESIQNKVNEAKQIIMNVNNPFEDPKKIKAKSKVPNQTTTKDGNAYTKFEQQTLYYPWMKTHDAKENMTNMPDEFGTSGSCNSTKQNQHNNIKKNELITNNTTGNQYHGEPYQENYPYDNHYYYKNDSYNWNGQDHGYEYHQDQKNCDIDGYNAYDSHHLARDRYSYYSHDHDSVKYNYNEYGERSQNHENSYAYQDIHNSNQSACYDQNLQYRVSDDHPYPYEDTCKNNYQVYSDPYGQYHQENAYDSYYNVEQTKNESYNDQLYNYPKQQQDTQETVLNQEYYDNYKTSNVNINDNCYQKNSEELNYNPNCEGLNYNPSLPHGESSNNIAIRKNDTNSQKDRNFKDSNNSKQDGLKISTDQN